MCKIWGKAAALVRRGATDGRQGTSLFGVALPHSGSGAADLSRHDRLRRTDKRHEAKGGRVNYGNLGGKGRKHQNNKQPQKNKVHKNKVPVVYVRGEKINKDMQNGAFQCGLRRLIPGPVAAQRTTRLAMPDTGEKHRRCPLDGGPFPSIVKRPARRKQGK